MALPREKIPDEKKNVKFRRGETKLGINLSYDNRQIVKSG
jgi:hypothetical protein